MTRDELRAWLTSQPLPTLQRWFARPPRRCESGNSFGDCEVASSALYLDLVRAGQDAGWSLVAAEFEEIGMHAWLRLVANDGTRFAVNVNEGSVRVLDEAEYIDANDMVSDSVSVAPRRQAALLHAIATRISAGTATHEDVEVWAAAFVSED